MKEISTSIVIQKPPADVWDVLTRFDQYPSWNPFVKSLEGHVKVGQRIKVKLPAMNFRPRVLAFEKNKEFRWLGHLLFPGLFDGEHRFQLQDNGDGTTTFIHSEIFKGILVPLFSRMLDNETRTGFQLMNEKLKLLVESSG
jgi:hypothetical protein